jgi:rhomboid protease GluP
MSQLNDGVRGEGDLSFHDGGEFEVCIRPPDESLVLPWLAVLSSARVPYTVESDERGWAAWVPVPDVARAEAELREYRLANRDWPPPNVPLALSGGDADAATLASLGVAFGLVLFHRYTGSYSASAELFSVGSAEASRIVAGEWWRTLTALTLHSDAGHVLANSLCCVAFGRSVCRQLGTGVGWGLIGVTGAVANGLTALSVPAGRTAIGASTATFGALGILAGLQLVRNVQHHGLARRSWGRVWLPLGAAAGLLALLGTSARSDLFGHLWGIVVGGGVGLVLGAVAACCGVGIGGALVQLSAGVGCVVLFVGAWWAALSG